MPETAYIMACASTLHWFFECESLVITAKRVPDRIDNVR